ncbi:MAG: 30S ribosomal protein S17 [Clostridia bacterium]|nr:30S ribosomal protein S17 [Clostridia bacterium]
MANELERNERKVRIGEVVSNKMDKTIVVLLKTKAMHPVYGKTLNQSTKVKADDPENQCDIGDRVEIVETRPLSKDKRWRLNRIVEKVK